MIRLDTPFFRPLASGATQKLSETLWDDLCGRYTVPDVPTYFLLQQLAVSQWQARELGLEQCGHFAEQTDPNSRVMLTLSRERRAECRLVAQLKRELKENLRGPQNEKSSKPDHTTASEMSNLANSSLTHTAENSNPSHAPALLSPKSSKPSNISISQAAKMSTPAHNFAASTPKVGRNQPCPCQSGRKFKHCCINKPAGPLDVMKNAGHAASVTSLGRDHQAAPVPPATLAKSVLTVTQIG